MGSTRRILGKQIDTKRLTRLVKGRVRFGKRIQLDQVGKVPSTREERELFSAIFEARRNLRESNKRYSEKFEALKTKAKIVFISKQLRHSLGRPPNVYEVLAVTALNYKPRLNSEELKRQVTMMNTMARHYPQHMTWTGSPSAVWDVIKKPFKNGKFALPAIEEILHDNKGVLSSEQIAHQLGAPWAGNVPVQSKINIACQLLETCRLIKKFPMSVVRGHPQAVWVHRAYQNPAVNYPNPAIEVLRKLASGKKKLTELFAEEELRKGRNTRSGTTSATFDQHTVYSLLKELEEMGLITTTRSKAIGFSKIIPGEAELTELGRKLWSEDHLKEKLRILLLGEKEVKPKLA